jgi:hypothetical protein
LGKTLDIPIALKPEQQEKFKDAFPALDPKHGIGARVDEKSVKLTLYVDPKSGNDANDGSKAKPLASLPKAVDLARVQLNKGIGVRIALTPGVYRLTEERHVITEYDAYAAVDLTKFEAKGREAPLIIEGFGGQAILSGAVEWKPQTWQLVDAEKKIYRHEWKQNWGFSTTGYYRPTDILLHRRELLALNGKRLPMAMIEETTFVDQEGRVYDEVGNLVKQNKVGGQASSRYDHVSWRGAGYLQPGQFGVAERDDHEGGDSIYLRLPEGMKDLKGATVEVGMVRTLMMAQGKSNLVLRNLTFQHTASLYEHNFAKAALATGDFLSPKDTHDWIIENCSFSNNGGMGLHIYNVSQVDVRNVKVENNGAMGAVFGESRRARFNKLEVVGNNLRAKASKWEGHGGGGFSFAGQDCVFTDCRFNNNYGFGFREDVYGVNIVHERCHFNNNQRGVMYEISWGPVLFKDCQINGNAEEGILLLDVHNVTIGGTEFINNKQVA